tara:strand:- start:556 stop:774 length:219 start_codon:yes stop_codon:yes gene_type:complete
MKLGDLVKHTSIDSLGVGLVTELLGVHCMVLWPRGDWVYADLMAGGKQGWAWMKGNPMLEANCMLEILNESR